MSIENRVADLEGRILSLYAERRTLNDQVMLITRRINEHEEQLSDLQYKRDLEDLKA